MGIHMANYAISVRRVVAGAFSAEPSLGTARYLRREDDAAPTPADGISLSKWTAALLGEFPVRPPNGSGRPVPFGDLVVVVHGYNTTVADAANARRQIGAGLRAAGFPALVIGFDWPSEGVALAYMEDRFDARETSMLLVKAGIVPLAKAMAADCDIRVHVLAHSMGCFVVREAFALADEGRLGERTWGVAQVAFVAGDVSAGSMSIGDVRTQSLYRRAHRVTNYFSGFDEVLQISNAKRLFIAPRVGRVGLPSNAPDKGIDVDCSQRFEAERARFPGFGDTHTWYFRDTRVFADLAHTLSGRLDRNVIPTRIALVEPNSFVLSA